MISRALDRLQNLTDKFELHLRYHQQRLRSFEAKIPLYIETKRYIVKTVASSYELEKVLKLRYKVFHNEFRKRKIPFGIDLDRFDFICDHLVIIDVATKELIGTYRIISSEFSQDFYSASEFDISEILAKEGIKLELGRACIHKDFRNGAVLSILWRGLMQYAAFAKADYLFGCASVKTTDIFESCLLYHYFKQNNLFHPNIRTLTTEAYTMPGFTSSFEFVEINCENFNEGRAVELLPPLLRLYFRAGAKICGIPALDREFKCIDFLTVLKIDDLSDSYLRKYGAGIETL